MAMAGARERLEEAEADLSESGLRRRIRNLKSRSREQAATIRTLEGEVDDLEDAARALDTLKATRPIKIKQRKKGTGRKPHTLVALVSDTHTCELVESERVNGFNAHDEKVGKARMENLFRDIADRWQKQNRDYDVREIVVCLMGDYLVNEMLHGGDSAASVPGMSPLDEMEFVTPILAGGIRHLLESTDAKIRVPCVDGNHGRMLKDKRATRRTAYSLEHMMHRQIAREFEGEKRVEFDVRANSFKVVDIAGFKLGITHGDSMRGGGGIGGLAIPFHKSVAKWKAKHWVDFVAIGHFHTSGYYVGVGMTNGSLVGTNEYAEHANLSYEPPQQWGFLVDHSTQRVGSVTPFWGRE